MYIYIYIYKFVLCPNIFLSYHRSKITGKAFSYDDDYDFGIQ